MQSSSRGPGWVGMDLSSTLLLGKEHCVGFCVGSCSVVELAQVDQILRGPSRNHTPMNRGTSQSPIATVMLHYSPKTWWPRTACTCLVHEPKSQWFRPGSSSSLGWTCSYVWGQLAATSQQAAHLCREVRLDAAPCLLHPSCRASQGKGAEAETCRRVSRGTAWLGVQGGVKIWAVGTVSPPGCPGPSTSVLEHALSSGTMSPGEAGDA